MATRWRRRSIRVLVSSLLVLLLGCAIFGWFITEELYVSSSGQRAVAGSYVIRTGNQIDMPCWRVGNMGLRCAFGVQIVQVQVRDARGMPIKGETYTLLFGPVRLVKS
jgi:hypothetical protein